MLIPSQKHDSKAGEQGITAINKNANFAHQRAFENQAKPHDAVAFNIDMKKAHETSNSDEPPNYDSSKISEGTDARNVNSKLGDGGENESRRLPLE